MDFANCSQSFAMPELQIIEQLLLLREKDTVTTGYGYCYYGASSLSLRLRWPLNLPLVFSVFSRHPSHSDKLG